jgi:hypothetical protein
MPRTSRAHTDAPDIQQSTRERGAGTRCSAYGNQRLSLRDHARGGVLLQLAEEPEINYSPNCRSVQLELQAV